MNVKDLRTFLANRKGILPVYIKDEATGKKMLLEQDDFTRAHSEQNGDIMLIKFRGEKAEKCDTAQKFAENQRLGNIKSGSQINFAADQSFTFKEKIKILFGAEVHTDFDVTIHGDQFHVCAKCNVGENVNSNQNINHE